MGQKEDNLFIRLTKTLKVRLGLIIFIVAAIVLEGVGLMEYYYIKRESSDPRAGNIFIILLIVGLLMVIFMVFRAIRNMKQLGKVKEVKDRMENELRIASGIQMSMIPKTFPPYPERSDLDLYAAIVPAKEVGGDLYDFHIRNEKLYFCIGDVSGKGVPASLVMAVTRSLFRTLSSHETSPGKIVSAMNNSMSEMNESNMFVTFFCGVLDLHSGHLRYCNAGHNAPLMLTDNIWQLPVIPNLPLGVVNGFPYSEQEMDMHYDNAIFLFTDGLTEAENGTSELFGLERTISALRERNSSEGHLRAMEKAVSDFVGDAPQSDDLTMFFIHYMNKEDSEEAERHLLLHNNIQHIPQLAGFVETIAQDMDLDQSIAMSLNLALEEAVTNVIMYAYPEGADGLVDVEAIIRKGCLKFIVTDNGMPFDPTAAPEADISSDLQHRKVGGLGIHLVRSIMDSINYSREQGRNILTMQKKI